MRIGIGAILGILGGPATYARELIRALAHVDAANEYVIMTDVPEALGVSAPNVRCVRAPLRSSLYQPVWDHVVVPYFVRRCAVDLYHGTKGTLPIWSGCRAVVTVHDLAVYHQPETFAWLQRVHQRSHTPFAVRRAARVIADSEYGRHDLLQRFGCAPDHVVAIPLAANAGFDDRPSVDDARIAAALELPHRYLLYAGTIQPRKNVEMLVAAFDGLANRGDVQLILAGRVRPGFQPDFLRAPPAQVRYLGPVSERELAVLYRRAMLFCSPSSYEGFGLSVLEAMRSGCLVITGRNSAVTEVVHDCGLLLDELSVAALRRALGRVVADSAHFDGMRQAARQRASEYNWDDTARRTLAVYREAVETVRAAA